MMSGAKYEFGVPSRINNLSIKGVVCGIPSQELLNNHFYSQFGEQGVEDTVKMIGVQSRRWVTASQTTADLCQAAAESLLAELHWEANSIDAVIFISQTPDYILPATACALHGRLKLKKSCITFDVNLGCSGYVQGLFLAGKLLDGVSIKRILLLVGDTISKVIEPSDRATALLFGDAGSATALEFDPAAESSYFVTGTDGNGERNLMIQNGGFKSNHPVDPRLLTKNPARLFMDGGEIFNFTLYHLPGILDELLDFSDCARPEINAFFLHQANKFMLDYLAKKLKIQRELMPTNIERFGNTSSASIPLLIADKLSAINGVNPKVAMFGFGVGYAWSAALIKIDSHIIHKIIER